MAYAGLIPFLILIIAFAGFSIPLTRASFIAALSGSLLTQTLFRADDRVWETVLQKTAVMMVEIGLILAGAFFFLETGKRTGVIDSLAGMVRRISADRAIQGVLVAFPLALMVEGSSGFGTPLLVIAPILVALDFPPALCVLLPLLNLVIGIPFGALGTPTRLGFPGASPSEGIFNALAVLVFLAPQMTLFLIRKGLHPSRNLWVFTLSLVYLLTGRAFAAEGSELAALGPAFFTLGYGLISARLFFSPARREASFDGKGIFIYGLLLFTLWIGKRSFMDEHIPGTEIRKFNPGLVFIFFSVLILLLHKRASLKTVVRDSIIRGRGTLTVLLCMTFLVQQLRANGSLDALTRTLPSPLLKEGSPVLGFLGSVFSGTATLSNLLLSKVVDPVEYVPLAAGSALGVPLAFQTVAALRVLLNQRLSEKQIVLLLAPMSLSFLLLITLVQALSR